MRSQNPSKISKYHKSIKKTSKIWVKTVNPPSISPFVQSLPTCNCQEHQTHIQLFFIFFLSISSNKTPLIDPSARFIIMLEIPNHKNKKIKQEGYLLLIPFNFRLKLNQPTAPPELLLSPASSITHATHLPPYNSHLQPPSNHPCDCFQPDSSSRSDKGSGPKSFLLLRELMPIEPEKKRDRRSSPLLPALPLSTELFRQLRFPTSVCFFNFVSSLIS